MRRTKRVPKPINTQSNARTIKKSQAKNQNQKSVNVQSHSQVQAKKYNLRKSERKDQETTESIENARIAKNKHSKSKNNKIKNTQSRLKPNKSQSKPSHQTPSNTHSNQSTSNNQHNSKFLQSKKRHQSKQKKKSPHISTNNENCEQKRPYSTRGPNKTSSSNKLFYYGGNDKDDIQECKKIVRQTEQKLRKANIKSQRKSRMKKNDGQGEKDNEQEMSRDDNDSGVQNHHQSNKQQQETSSNIQKSNSHKLKHHPRVLSPQHSRTSHQTKQQNNQSSRYSNNNDEYYNNNDDKNNRHIVGQQQLKSGYEKQMQIEIDNGSTYRDGKEVTNQLQNVNQSQSSDFSRMLPSYSSADNSQSIDHEVIKIAHEICQMLKERQQKNLIDDPWTQVTKLIFSPNHQPINILTDFTQHQYYNLLGKIDNLSVTEFSNLVNIGEHGDKEIIQLKDMIRETIQVNGTIPWILPQWRLEDDDTKIINGKDIRTGFKRLFNNGWKEMTGDNDIWKNQQMSEWSDKWSDEVDDAGNDGNNNNNNNKHTTNNSSTHSNTYYQRAIQPQYFDNYYTPGMTYLYSTLINQLNTRDQFSSFQTFCTQNYLQGYYLSRFHYKNYCYEKTLYTDSAQFDKDYWQDMVDNHCLLLPGLRLAIEQDWKEKFQKGWDQYDEKVGVKMYDDRGKKEGREQLEKKLGIGGNRKERVKVEDVKRIMQDVLNGDTMKAVKVRKNPRHTKRKTGQENQTVAQEDSQQPFNPQTFIYQTILQSAYSTNSNRHDACIQDVYKALNAKQPESTKKKQIQPPKVKKPQPFKTKYTEEDKKQRHKILIDMDAKFKKKRRRQWERMNRSMVERSGIEDGGSESDE